MGYFCHLVDCMVLIRCVLVREAGTVNSEPETAKIEIPLDIQESWQKSVDLIARIARVPAALVMRVHAEEIEVFRSSRSDGNPYEIGEKAPLDTGLYCETVMANRDRLLVPNALADPDWADNPDVALNMISYMGWPITWPNGDLFGTICILDSKENRYDETHSQLLYQFKELIEFSLRSLYEEQLLSSSRLVSQQLDRERRALKKLATTDSLTGIFNRRAFLGLGNQLFVRHHEEQTSIALFVVDVDRFNAINESHVHLTGDSALAHLAALLVRLSRRVDVLARFGGDEFILLVPEATPGDAAGFAERIMQTVHAEPLRSGSMTIPLTLSIGIFAAVPDTPSLQAAIRRADSALYRAKEQGRDRFVLWKPDQAP